ncbi:FAD-binding domain-containing protein [Gonapodya prolifera JEL478]|uniref:FAD-binding domain-containing protein n=1 Tax=Gonapodya prolifera (strain JEL478) TaxID=1344416 RepID=A0A139A6H4_GONPJ|nr:FAD-binding domain-containing protein [Gonapodya prolifera JEL478]|eukprot:KXS11973.1 FAD-binding domain-containing protein [Gonapodya prolifera JEL478]
MATTNGDANTATSAQHSRLNSPVEPSANGPPFLTTRRFSTFAKETILPSFRRTIKGAVLPPGTKGYEESLLVYNGAIQPRPVVVVRPYDSEDVAQVVRICRRFGLTMSVKSGGATGYGISGQVVVDLAKTMNSVWVVTEGGDKPVVRFDGGCRVADIDEATCRRGFITPLATYQGVGAGSVLGGGLGYVGRKWGLSVDNLVEAEVVTADGKVLVANEKQNQDLFWALRGAGSNFGVVTSVVSRLHKQRTCYSGVVIYPMESVYAAKLILGRWSEAIGYGAREEMSTSAKLGCDVNGSPLVMLSFCYSGPEDDAKQLIHPFMSSLPYVPVMNSLRTRDYIQQQRNTTQYIPAAGYRYGIRGEHLTQLTPEVISFLAEAILHLPQDATRSVIDVVLLGGAITKVDEDATAWVHRKAAYEVTMIGTWEEEEQDVENKKWLDETLARLKQFSFGPPPNSQDVPAAEMATVAEKVYGSNLNRLRALKKKYDPTNFFRFNLNIEPEGGAVPDEEATEAILGAQVAEVFSPSSIEARPAQ